MSHKKFSISMLFVVLFSYGIYGISSDGIKTRFSNNQMMIYNNYSVEEFRRLKDKNTSTADWRACGMRLPVDACRFGDQSYVVIGDSFAGMYEYALQEKLNETGKGLISFAYEQCPFVDESLWFVTIKSCPDINKQRWEEIDKFKDKKTFVVAAEFNQFFVAKQKIKDGEILLQQDELNQLAWSSFISNIKNYSLLDIGLW